MTQNDVASIGLKYPILFNNHKAYLPDLSPFKEEFTKSEFNDIENYKITECIIINKEDKARKLAETHFKTAILPGTSKAVVGAAISKLHK